MLYSNVADAAPAFARLLAEQGAGGRSILIVTHVNPDGDAIGSLTGLGLALEAMGHRVTMLAPSPVPPFVARMPAVQRVQCFTDQPALPEDVDLVMLVDTGDLRRIGRVWDEARSYLEARPLAIIDHHVTNSGEGSVNLVAPDRASTCELVYELVRAWDAPVTPDIATALMLGLVTDTQSFRTSNTSPESLRVAAELLEAGADRERIVQDVYRSIPAPTARLLGLALGVMQYDEQIVWTHVSLAMQEAVGVDVDAYSEVTDYLAKLGGFRASVLLRERTDGTIKVSFRSLPGVDVAAVAQRFGGGGHRQAAGCTIEASLSGAEAIVLAELRAQLAGGS
jgi:phosphoesterase RecJ-like protein